MKNQKWLDVKKIKSTKDANGNTCYNHILEGNRSIGKTFNLLKYFVNQYINRHEEFVILYRNKLQAGDTHEIFSDMLSLYYPNWIAHSSTMIVKDVIWAVEFENIETHEIKTFGYAISMSDVDKVKQYSSIFAKVKYTLLDEFQTESGRYLKDEFKKYQSIIMSIARGGGAVIRNIFNFLVANKVDIYNPYYLGFKCLDKITNINDNCIIALNGLVIHLLENEQVKKEMKNNAMLSAFINSDYSNYAINNNPYINRKSFLIRKSEISTKKCNYIFSVRKNNKTYSVWVNARENIMIFTDIDNESKRLTFTCDDESGYKSIKSEIFNGLKKLVKKYKHENKLYYSTVNALEVIEDILK